MRFARVLLVFILRLAFIALKFFGYGLMYLPLAIGTLVIGFLRLNVQTSEEDKAPDFFFEGRRYDGDTGAQLD